jgi:tetratricopeptide (TPR) repeat protein
MDKGKIQTFREQLTRLLAKYCDESTVQNIASKLNLIRDSEKDLMAQANEDAERESGQDLVEGGFVYQIIAECQLVLPKKEFLGILTEISNLCVDFGEYATAEALFSNAIETAKDGVRFFNQAAEALQKRADVLLRQARWDRAKTDLKESRRLFTRTKNELGIGKIENSLGIFMAQQGNTKESVAHFKRAASLFEKAKQTDLASTAYMNMGIVATMIGKFDEALAAYKRALPEFERAGDVPRLAELHHNLGMLFLARAEMDSALGQFDESLNCANQVHYDALIGLASLGKAAAYIRKKDFALAHLFGNRALSIFRRLSAHLSIADSYKIKGIIQRELKHYDIAELYFHSSISLNQGYNNPLNLGEAYLEIGLLHKECGDKAKAKEVFQKSLKCFQQVGAKHNIEQVREQLGSLKS